MSLLRWIDETAKINRGKLKIWTNPSIPSAVSTKSAAKKEKGAADEKIYAGNLLGELCLDMIVNHLNKMFSGRDVCIPARFLTKETLENIKKRLKTVHREDKDFHNITEKELSKIAEQISNSLIRGDAPSDIASEVLWLFPDSVFLQIAELRGNLTLESIFASRDLEKSWTFIRLCDLLGKNPKKFAKQLNQQPELREGLIKEIKEAMESLLKIRTPYEISDPVLAHQYRKEGMWFDETEETRRKKFTGEEEETSLTFLSHFGIVRRLLMLQKTQDQKAYEAFLRQLDEYKNNKTPGVAPPQLPSIDHHPTDIQAMSVKQTSRPYLIKILKTHPDKSLLELCKNKNCPIWYVLRKIIEADNQSRNTFMSITGKGKDVLAWGNQHLPRNKTPKITDKDAREADFTKRLSNYWYEESFNRASIPFDFADNDQIIFKRKRDKTLSKRLAEKDLAKTSLKEDEHEKRRELESEKAELIQRSKTLQFPKSSMVGSILSAELMPMIEALTQQAKEYLIKKKNFGIPTEKVAEQIIKNANKKKFFAGLDPEIYDQEKILALLEARIQQFKDKQNELAGSSRQSTRRPVHTETRAHTSRGGPSTKMLGASAQESSAPGSSPSKKKQPSRLPVNIGQIKKLAPSSPSAAAAKSTHDIKPKPLAEAGQTRSIVKSLTREPRKRSSSEQGGARAKRPALSSIARLRSKSFGYQKLDEAKQPAARR